MHEKTGRYCVGFTGDEYLKIPLWKIEAYSDVYSPIALPDPTEAQTVPELVSALKMASDDTQGIVERPEDRGIIAAILEGVNKEEEFAPGYVGRNYAALLLAAYLLQRYSETEAWDRLQNWNATNSPPLGEHPDDDRNELRYVFERAKLYVRANSDQYSYQGGNSVSV